MTSTVLPADLWNVIAALGGPVARHHLRLLSKEHRGSVQPGDGAVPTVLSMLDFARKRGKTMLYLQLGTTDFHSHEMKVYPERGNRVYIKERTWKREFSFHKHVTVEKLVGMIEGAQREGRPEKLLEASFYNVVKQTKTRGRRKNIQRWSATS